MLVGVEYNKLQHAIVASYFDKSGKIAYMPKRLMDEDVFNWKLTDQQTPFKSWDEKPIIKSKAGYGMNRYRLEELLHEKYSKAERKLLYSDNWPKPHILDIETRVNERNDFPNPEEALFDVILIQLVYGDNVYILSTMDKLSPEQISETEKFTNDYFREHGIETNYAVKYYHFNTETEMLAGFFYKILPNIHFVTGWNVLSFDWQTLFNRAQTLGIEPFKRLSSRRTVTRHKVPIHIGILDYMEVCQEFKPVKMPENYTLDHMSDRILGCKKLQHPYNSFYEFQQDVPMFIRYGIIDPCLVDQIERKKSLLVIAYEMANIAQIEITKVFGPVFKTELFLCREFMSQGLHMPDIQKSGHREKYPGAYVMPPKPGYYGNIGCFDFASQYPNIQMQWYIDPKGYLGKRGEVDLSKYDAKDVVLTKRDTLFLKTENCASRRIQRRLYDRRVSIKGKGGELQQIKQRMNALGDEKRRLLEQLETL